MSSASGAAIGDAAIGPQEGRPRGPRDVVRARRKADRRRQIVEAASRLWEVGGFHDTSVQAVAQEAGVSVGSIYAYVENKDDLLLLVITDILEEYARELPRVIAAEDGVQRQLMAGFVAYCEIVDRRRAAVELAYRETKTLDEVGRKHTMALEVQTTSLFVDIIERGVSEGVFRPVRAEVFAYNIVLVAHGWALKHWYFGPRMSLAGYIEIQTEFLLSALRR